MNFLQVLGIESKSIELPNVSNKLFDVFAKRYAVDVILYKSSCLILNLMPRLEEVIRLEFRSFRIISYQSLVYSSNREYETSHALTLLNLLLVLIVLIEKVKWVLQRVSVNAINLRPVFEHFGA